MKAIVLTKPGGPETLQLRELPQPVPKDDEVLLKVHAATVTAGDVVLRKANALLWLVMRLTMGFKKKRVLGHEFAGEIAAVGKDVHTFTAGDQVFGTTTKLAVGSYAEYVAVPAGHILAPKPANLSYAEAAAVPVGAMTANYFLQQGHIAEGQRALIYGASGSVGSYAVQLAKAFGAEVTGVASSANLGLVTALGADRVIDYTKEAYSAGQDRYDLIFDAVGKSSPAEGAKVLAEDGHFVSVAKGLAKERQEDLLFLSDLIAAGKMRPYIDQLFPLPETAAAHRYVEQGHKRGNVVIQIGNAVPLTDAPL
jgi:NADPH:quinone reductase-like Zn-dependent oxidoreductase